VCLLDQFQPVLRHGHGSGMQPARGIFAAHQLARQAGPRSLFATLHQIGSQGIALDIANKKRGHSGMCLS